MGLSSKKSTVKTSENTSQNATVTPQNPAWVTDSLAEYTDRIGAFGDMDPNSFVAPASPLQQRAWHNAGNMGGWQGQTALASQMAGRAAMAPANLGGSASTYAAPQMGNAQGYAAARVGQPIGGGSHGYSGEQIAPVSEATSQTAAQNTQNYFNPYTRDVVNTSLDDMDRQAGSIRARQAAEAARNGAFGGSRYGIREAETEGELARARASMDANLRSAAFDKSVAFGAADADRGTQVSMFNSGANNARNLAQADMNQRGSMFDAGALNEAARFNVGSQNDFASQQAGLNAQAGQFNAGAQNQMSMFNAGQRDNAAGRMMQGAGMMGDLANSYATNMRGDLALMNDMGAQQQAVEQAYRTAPLSQLQTMGQLYGATPFDLFRGVNTVGTSAGNSTSTTTQSGSPLGSVLGLASMFMPSGGVGSLFKAGGGAGLAPISTNGFGMSANNAFNRSF